MILTIALNPAVDKTYLLPDFAPFGINRAADVSAVAGGKANNVARVLRVLGRQVRATGFLAGGAGRWIDRELTAAGIESRFLEVEGESRTCLALVDPIRNGVGEIREPGPVIGPSDQDRFLTQLPAIAAGCSLAVLSGSLPVGVPPEYAGRVVAALRAMQIPVILDLSGEALKAGASARPFLIKPNSEELATLAGRTVPVGEAAGIVTFLARQTGVRIAASLGKEGVVAAEPDGEVITAVPPAVQAVNTVGAGDSLVAGLAAGLSEGEDLASALRLGVACGTASTLTRGVAMVRMADVRELLPLVAVCR